MKLLFNQNNFFDMNVFLSIGLLINVLSVGIIFAEQCHNGGHSKQSCRHQDITHEKDGKRCAKAEPDYPVILRNRNFTCDKGLDWIFGQKFSPVFDGFMYRALEHTDKFITEFYVNDFSNTTCNINYACVKYEVVDKATVLLWVFETMKGSFNSLEPSLCEICSGVLVRAHRITDLSSGQPVSKVSPPELSLPTVPELCSPNCYGRL